MDAKTMFANSITFENAENVRRENNEKYLKEEAQRNDIVIGRIPNIINECRIKNAYYHDNLIYIFKYNTQLAIKLQELGFKVYRPNPLPGDSNWHPDMDDDLYIRDDELYNRQKLERSKNVCSIL